MAVMKFDLVSPERNMASGEASLVTLPGAEGDLGAMPGHAPFLTTLRPGVVGATMDGAVKQFVVYGGFAEVSPEGVSVLADEVHGIEELDAAALDAKITAAEEAVTAGGSDDQHRRAQYVLDLKALKDAPAR